MTSIIELKNESDKVFFRINKKTKKGKYTLVNASNRNSEILFGKAIAVEGFDSFPSGFYKKDGYGFTKTGNAIIREINEHYGKKISVTVSKNQISKLDARGKVLKLTINHAEMMRLNQTVSSISREANAQITLEVHHFLGTTFPQLRKLKDSQAGYVPGRLAEVLGFKNVLRKMNKDDQSAFEELIPEYLSNIPGTLRAKKKLKIIYDALDAGKKIYLQKVLKEFKTKLSRSTHNENTWQEFLSSYILILIQSYGEVLEKKSVSLQGKFPDFLLVDPYGYVDIYEIKKPNTNLLNFDRGRNNYYWDVEVSKAIAQVENYIHQMQRNADTFRNDIKDSKGIDVSVVRPRGYIIAGKRSMLTSKKMEDDFRILCESLKNVDVILYDDLLANLESLSEKFTNQEE